MEFSFSSTIWSLVGSIVTAMIFMIGWSVLMGRKLQIIDDLKTGFKDLHIDVRDLINRISKMEGKLEGVSASTSPVQPTELGAKYIRESGLEKILDERKTLLCENLKNSLPQNYADYDVQEIARRIMLSLKDEPMMKPVKEYAFKEGVEVEVILGVGALWLRDDFLKAPRGIVKTGKKLE